MNATTLTTENSKAFVLTYPFVANTHDSHPYSMTVGPDGAFYIADAAANAILRRSKTGKYSVLTEVPGIANPTPVGPRALPTTGRSFSSARCWAFRFRRAEPFFTRWI